MTLFQKYAPLYVLIAITFLMISCEKVVELDLDDAKQMLVVEAIVHDSLGDNFVKLSKTKPFNDNSVGYETISGALVIVTDNLGNSFTFTETSSGNYSCPTLQGISGRAYFLTVNVNGKVVTATSVMNPKVSLDSLSHEKRDRPFNDPNKPIEYGVRTYFFDTPNFTNYYRIKAFNKGVQEKGYIVLNDDLLNGGIVVFPVFRVNYVEGDTAIIQLLSIDEANFRYFNAIASSQNGEVPGNPETNLVGEDVVGYFGAYAKSERRLIITPLP